MGTMTVWETLTTISCGECGGVYAIGERYRQEKHDAGGFWNCPYCKCSWGYGESKIDRLKQQLNAAEATAKWHRERAEDNFKEAEHFRHSRDAIKGVVTKIKRRVGNGVCPCCKRTFQDLARHMKSQHPKFTEEKSRQ